MGLMGKSILVSVIALWCFTSSAFTEEVSHVTQAPFSLHVLAHAPYNRGALARAPHYAPARAPHNRGAPARAPRYAPAHAPYNRGAPARAPHYAPAYAPHNRGTPARAPHNRGAPARAPRYAPAHAPYNRDALARAPHYAPAYAPHNRGTPARAPRYAPAYAPHNRGAPAHAPYNRGVPTYAPHYAPTHAPHNHGAPAHAPHNRGAPARAPHYAPAYAPNNRGAPAHSVNPPSKPLVKSSVLPTAKPPVDLLKFNQGLPTVRGTVYCKCAYNDTLDAAKPVQGVVVRLICKRKKKIVSTKTDENGHFSLLGPKRVDFRRCRVYLEEPKDNKCNILFKGRHMKTIGQSLNPNHRNMKKRNISPLNRVLHNPLAAVAELTLNV